MDNRKWLMNEIDSWVSKGIIDSEAADNIRALYPAPQRQNILLIFFSVLGALLIGGGIILICARNWYEFPLWFRVALSFLPLVLAQALAAFTAFRKRDSMAFREGVGIFLCITVFSSIALIGQIFHLPGDFGQYMLSCALLCLPVIYLLPGVGSLIIYGTAAVTWCGTQSDSWQAFWVLALFALAAPGLIAFWRKGLFRATSQLLLWVYGILGFIALCFVISTAGDSSLIALAIAAYVSLIYCTDSALFKGAPPALRPLGVLGTIGTWVFLFFFSYSRFWGEPSLALTNEVLLSLPLPLILIICCAYMLWKSPRHPLFSAVGIAPVFTALLSTFSGYMPEILPALLVNLIILALGISFIVRGAKSVRIPEANFGMILVLALIVFRFFDWDMDFLTRGIAFVILGAAFLVVNLVLVKKRRAGESA